MKKIKEIFTVCALVIIVPSCDKLFDSKGKVKFQNRSVTNRSYDIIWDGSVIETLYPQEDSKTYDVAIGDHTLSFEFSNSGALACRPADPKIAANQVQTFTCSE